MPVTPRRRDKVFAEKVWNRFRGDVDKVYMFQPRVKQDILVPDQIQPEVWITSKLGQRHVAVSGVPLRQINGIVQPGDVPQTPEHERKLMQSMFPKGLGPTSRSETSVICRALEATAGIGVGNPLLQDERVAIKYY